MTQKLSGDDPEKGTVHQSLEDLDPEKETKTRNLGNNVSTS